MPSTERLDAVLADARNQMRICNACRYCEGYCAVFPAMEQRRHDFLPSPYTSAGVRFASAWCVRRSL